MNSEISFLKERARSIRRRIVETAFQAHTGHIASALSMVDLLTFLYFHQMNLEGHQRDAFVLSKGHGALGLYATLCEKGFLQPGELADYHNEGTRWTSFPTEPFPEGLFFSSGSLGHGLSTACGAALAYKNEASPQKVYALLSDGECQEGSVWEAALFASQHRLSNLVVLIDFNKLQALGRVEDILGLEPFVDKWTSFGWNACCVDGHCFESLFTAVSALSDSSKPKVLVAHTVKGKGVSFMEHSVDWHYLPIPEERIARVLAEVGE